MIKATNVSIATFVKTLHFICNLCIPLRTKNTLLCSIYSDDNCRHMLVAVIYNLISTKQCVGHKHFYVSILGP